MSRQLEQASEESAKRRSKAIAAAVEFELVDAVSRSGAAFSGLAVKMTQVECLLIIKGVLAGRPQVAFVGSETLGGALIKAVKLGKRDKLAWRPDKYVGVSEGADS